MVRSNDTNKIIVVGIPKTMNDEGLEEMLEKFGSVLDAKVVMDPATKASKGFGFVTFTKTSSKRSAIQEMNKKAVEGRILNVREIIPKTERVVTPSNAPKPVCWAFQKGLCKKGDSCQYKHEGEEGGYGNCFEFQQTGSCKRGDKCKFHHAEKTKHAETEKPLTDEAKKDIPRVCYAFQKGTCHRGKQCRFLHQKLEEVETEVVADKRKREDNDEDNAATKKTKHDFEVVGAEEPQAKPSIVKEEEDEDDDEVEVSSEPALGNMMDSITEASLKSKTLVDLIQLEKQVKQIFQRVVKFRKAAEFARNKDRNTRTKSRATDVDMGAAFDEPISGGASKGRPNTLSAKEQRKQKKLAKSEALKRLRSKGEITA